MSIHVVIDVEVTWETGAGILRLQPRSLCLAVTQEADPAPCRRMLGVTGELQRVQRPCGLRRRAHADTGKRFVLIGMAALAPAAIGVLPLQYPFSSASHHAAPGVQRSKRAHHTPRAIDVVDAPAPEPGTPRTLLASEVRQSGCDVGMFWSITDSGKHLDDMRRHVLRRRIEHRS